MSTLPSEVTAIIPTVATELRAGILGANTPGDTRSTALATVALRLCHDYAPAAPIDVLQEAGIRLGGWLLGRQPHVMARRVKDPSGTEMELTYRMAATANGLRESGASFLLDSFRAHNARIIGGSGTTTTRNTPAPGGGGTMNGTSPTVRVALLAFRNPGAVFSDVAAMTAQELFDGATLASGASERAVSVAAPVECHQQRVTLAPTGFQWLTVAVPEGTDTPSHFRLSDSVAPDNWGSRWRQASGMAASRGTNYSVYWYPVVQTSWPATVTVEWPLA